MNFDLTDNSSSDLEMDEDLVLDKIVNRLTEFVRQQYCSYLEKLLVENYKNWCLQSIGILENPPDVWIKQCVKIYEENALKSCMIVQFYRQAMLRTMTKIRKLTFNGKLADKVKNYRETDSSTPKTLFKKVHVGTQTKDAIQEHAIDTTFPNAIILQEHKASTNSSVITCNAKELSLDDKLNVFRKRFLNNNLSDEPKRKCLTNLETNLENPKSKSISNESKHRNIEQSTSESAYQSTNNINYVSIEEELNEIFEPKEDDIAKELDKLFQDEQTELDELFGNNPNLSEDPEIDKILKKIECSDLPMSQKCLIENNSSEQESITNKSIQKAEEEEKELSRKSNIKVEETLRNSIWPCELHMRRQRLREILWRIGEDYGMICHENLRVKFVELFGEDDEEEFAPFSPTLELDEILLSSCKKRIAPWIVKFLMIPMKEGKIGDRVIFKQFAKHMSHKIILEDQYPSEYYIRASIEHYFNNHNAVMTLEDIKL